MTNHTHVLVVLSNDPEARIRDLAEAVGITERAVQRILSELISEGVLKVKKQGRRNCYTINRKIKLRHPLENSHQLGELLDIFE